MHIIYNIKKLAIASVLVTALCFQAQADKPSFSGSLGFDYNSHFISSGKDVWGTGGGKDSLFNPSANFDFNFGNYGFYLGAWADVNDKVISALDGDVQEIDLWIGGYYSFDEWTVNVALQQWYYSDEVEGIVDVTFSYEHKYSPWIKFRTRVEQVGTDARNQKGTIVSIGGSYSWSGEFGIPESFAFTIPASLGYSVSDGYFGKVGGVDGLAGAADLNDGLAFITSGLHVSYPLEIVPEWFGSWDWHGGVDYYHTPTSVTGNAQDNFLTFSTGIGVAF